jgi:hypothetical protein
MSKILGIIPGLLADLLDIEGGKIQATELRDREGISLVYDIGQLVESQSLRIDIRTFGHTVAASTTSNASLTGLPAMARVIGIDVSVDSDAKLDQVAVMGLSIGGTGTNLPCHMFWHWITGDLAVARPGGFLVGANSQAELLYPPSAQTFIPTPYIDVTATARRGYNAIQTTVKTNAFGAGNCVVSGHIVLMFPVALGGRTADLMPPPAR